MVRSDQGRDVISTGSLFPSCTCSSRARHLYLLHVWREKQVVRNLFCCHIPNLNLIKVAAALSEGRHDILWSAAVQFAAFTEPTTFKVGLRIQYLIQGAQELAGSPRGRIAANVPPFCMLHVGGLAEADGWGPDRSCGGNSIMRLLQEATSRSDRHLIRTWATARALPHQHEGMGRKRNFRPNPTCPWEMQRSSLQRQPRASVLLRSAWRCPRE